MLTLAAAGAGAKRALGAVAGFVGALPGWGKGALVAVGLMYLAYEGIGPFKPLPFWEIGFPGRMDRAVEVQRAICEADKARSEKLAREDDQQRQAERIESMTNQLHRANERTLNAQADYRRLKGERAADDDEAKAAGRPKLNCEPGPRASRSLQRRELPYPSAQPSGN